MVIPAAGTVLCPVDLSEQSQRALCHAAAFATALESRLFVLRVDPRADGSTGERAAAAQELDAFVRNALPAWITDRSAAEAVVKGGVPAETILAFAAGVGAQLIVMGTRGRGALARALAGSTAAALLQNTTVPIAVVPPMRTDAVSLSDARQVFRFRSIVVPMALQGETTGQLKWAGRLSAGADRPLLILHVVPPGQARGSELDRVRAAASAVQAVNGFRAVVREGRIVPEVIAAVKDEDAGLVVMGRSSNAPGAMAYEVLRRTEALVLMAP